MLDNVPVVRAGDVLVVSFDRATTQQERDAFWGQVKEGLPGVRVAFLENVSGLAVFRPETGAAEAEGK